MEMNGIIDALQKWNQERSDVGAAMGYLNNGVGFEIDRTIYDSMTTDSPTEVHAYLGVVESGLWLFLIDDVQDAGTPSKDVIFPVQYLPALSSSTNIPHFSSGDDPTHLISVTSGLERSFRWHLQRYDWLNNHVNATYEPDLGEGIFQAFTIPFSDLHDIFSADSNNEKAVVLFGLKHESQANPSVEFVLWGDSFETEEMLADVSLPVPPFKPTQMSQWQLLQDAGVAPS